MIIRVIAVYLLNDLSCIFSVPVHPDTYSATIAAFCCPSILSFLSTCCIKHKLLLALQLECWGNSPSLYTLPPTFNLSLDSVSSHLPFKTATFPHSLFCFIVVIHLFIAPCLSIMPSPCPHSLSTKVPYLFSFISTSLPFCYSITHIALPSTFLCTSFSSYRHLPKHHSSHYSSSQPLFPPLVWCDILCDILSMQTCVGRKGFHIFVWKTHR